MQYPMIAQPQYGFAPTMPMMARAVLLLMLSPFSLRAVAETQCWST
jgi:hypothetical protein